MRIVGFLLVLIMAITGCSDTARRQEVLSKSGELEVAWNNLDQECMATLDTLKITLKPWIPDTTGHAQRVFAGNDSLKKIFSGNLSRLEKEYSLYEQMLVTLKKITTDF